MDVAVREFTLEKGHGFVHYLLLLTARPSGVVEVKPAGYSFTTLADHSRFESIFG